MQKNHMLHFNPYMDGLVQERRNFIANMLELHLFSLTHWYMLNNFEATGMCTSNLYRCPKFIWYSFLKITIEKVKNIPVATFNNMDKL